MSMNERKKFVDRSEEVWLEMKTFIDVWWLEE